MHDPQRNKSGRLRREKQTLQAMVRVYCRAHHAAKGPLCAECQSLCDYALGRLDRCPFGAEKTTCARCTTHCYKSAMRAQIKTVMRYSGPRMLARHPVLALLHVLDGLRTPRERQGRRTSKRGSPRAMPKG